MLFPGDDFRAPRGAPRDPPGFFRAAARGTVIRTPSPHYRHGFRGRPVGNRPAKSSWSPESPGEFPRGAVCLWWSGGLCRSAGSPWRAGRSAGSLLAPPGVPVLYWLPPESRFSGWAGPRGIAESRFSSSSGRGRIRNSRRFERVQGAADSSIEPDWTSESVCRRIPRIR